MAGLGMLPHYAEALHIIKAGTIYVASCIML